MQSRPLLIASLLCLTAFASAAPAAAALDKPAAVCQASVGKALLSFQKAKIKAWTRCLDAMLTGGSCDEAARDAAIATAAQKSRDIIAAKCPGSLLFDAPPAGVGFAATCSLKSGNLGTGEQACAALPATTAAELASCLQCWKQAEIDRLLEAVHPCLAGGIPDGSVAACGTAPSICPDPAAARAEIACLRAGAKATTKVFLAEEKALEKCLNARRAGKTTETCPDAKADAKINASLAGAVAATAAACSELPSFWDLCPFDTEPCDEPLATVSEMSACTLSGATEAAHRVVCEQYPDAASDGIACPDACVPFAADDVCNGIDDDCDDASADGSEDPGLGAACDGADADLCSEGTVQCSAGALECADASGDSIEICNGNDDDCDGSTDEDFPRNDDPACATSQFFLGSIAGDVGAGILEDSWYDEEWLRFTLREDSDSSVYLSATIQLTSPAGVDFDLYVHCLSCEGALAGVSATGGMTGHTDVVNVRANDEFGESDTIDVLVEVRHFQSDVCSNWSLLVIGNTDVTTATCP